MSILYDLIFKITKFTDTLYNLLFHEFPVGNYTFSVWEVLSGGFLIVLMGIWLVKKLVPVA